jgi:outer membrane protein OmpA-like peptidoglycan-associated protein
MGRNRINPWPSIADLFSALLVGSIAALVLVSVVQDRNQEESKRVKEQIANSLSNTKGDARVVSCDPDTCIEVHYRFERNGFELSDEAKNEIARACDLYKAAYMKIDPSLKLEVSMVIEGHTDDTQARELTGRARDLFNWDLSSKRANAVLYEFLSCGVKPPEFSISATGHADTRPLCTDDTEECRESNRRTTLRLRADPERVAEKLKKIAVGAAKR